MKISDAYKNVQQILIIYIFRNAWILDMSGLINWLMTEMSFVSYVEFLWFYLSTFQLFIFTT